MGWIEFNVEGEGWAATGLLHTVRAEHHELLHQLGRHTRARHKIHDRRAVLATRLGCT